MLPEREEPVHDGPKVYLKGNEFLLKNPYPRKSKSKTLRRAGSIRKAGKKRGGSPKSPRRGRRGTLGGGDELGL